ncbi:MAG: helix-turn-helix domain-containing protein [Umezawaea sp.]
MSSTKRRSSPVAHSLDAADIAKRAGKGMQGASPELLSGYVVALATASSTLRPLDEDQIRDLHDIGGRAAQRGVPMRDLIDLYLKATWLAWSSLPAVTAATTSTALRDIGDVVFRAADTAVLAVVEGYEQAQRWSVRQEESLRREFVDDLLDGRNPGNLAERAERFGLRLAGSHVVVTVHAAKPFIDGGLVARRVETSLHVRLGSRDVLVTTKDGLLVCVAPEAVENAVDEYVRQVAAAVGSVSGWRAGVGRPQPGPGGVVRSFEQAKQVVDIAGRLRLPGTLHRAADLLVYQVLLRDSAALAELVTVVLDPLRGARGGGQPLLDTLSAYFAAGGVATVTARALQVGVRTVTYRLRRITELTGYCADDPEQAFALRVAVLGAGLLGWPEKQVPAEP